MGPLPRDFSVPAPTTRTETWVSLIPERQKTVQVPPDPSRSTQSPHPVQRRQVRPSLSNCSPGTSPGKAFPPTFLGRPSHRTTSIGLSDLYSFIVHTVLPLRIPGRPRPLILTVWTRSVRSSFSSDFSPKVSGPLPSFSLYSPRGCLPLYQNLECSSPPVVTDTSVQVCDNHNGSGAFCVRDTLSLDWGCGTGHGKP